MVSTVFENADCIVTEKPAGLPCHQLKNGGIKKSAFAITKENHPQIAFPSSNPLEGGLIYRLDNDTSGFLLWATNKEAFDDLRSLLKENQIRKEYLALVQGSITTKKVFEESIAHHSKNKKKMTVVTTGMRHFRGEPKPAITKVFPLVNNEHFSLVKVAITGGRRHQIRVHLSHAGFPLVGDMLYKGPRASSLPGHALHNHLLNFNHTYLTLGPPEPFLKEVEACGLVFQKQFVNSSKEKI